MGYMYGMLQVAKNKIMVGSKRRVSLSKPVPDIIEDKAKGRVDTELHMTAYYFSPCYHYYLVELILNFIRQFKKTQKSNALMHCIDIFYPKAEIQDKIRAKEFIAYKTVEGVMRSRMAERHLKGFNGTDNLLSR